MVCNLCDIYFQDHQSNPAVCEFAREVWGDDLNRGIQRMIDRARDGEAVKVRGALTRWEKWEKKIELRKEILEAIKEIDGFNLPSLRVPRR